MILLALILAGVAVLAWYARPKAKAEPTVTITAPPDAQPLELVPPEEAIQRLSLRSERFAHLRPDEQAAIVNRLEAQARHLFRA